MKHLRISLAWLAAALVAACGGGSSMPPPSAYAATNLVSDTVALSAAHIDPNLVNGWGLAFNPNGFAWVANNGTSTSTLYDGNGVPQSLVVSVPATRDSDVTGIVFNSTQDFKVSAGGAASPAAFLFVGEAGTLSGWSPAASPAASITVYDGSANNAVYKSLAIATFGGANYLYAADFHNSRVDVFDRNFTRVTLTGNFAVPGLPAGYAPFGMQAIGDRIYVAFAKHEATGDDEAHGAGLGLLAVFDTGGTFIKQLVAAGGPLNAPWGITMAPGNFGSFSNTLLVGNFGDGTIHSFDPVNGGMLGTISKVDGTPIVIDGLWGIAFGNDLFSQPKNTLFFAAGPGGESHGLYGRIDLK